MAIRPVLHYPNPILKAVAAEIAPGPAAIRLATDLVETMRASPACVGLAANQIGEPHRAFCVDVADHKRAQSKHGLIVMINPVVIAREGTDMVREGCMSLPDFTGNIRRASHIVVRGSTPDGEEISVEADAFEARALQHEIDHLQGLLFLDRVVSLSTDLFRRKRYAGPPK